MLENLAPAGNRAALERADAAGADAVYLGYSAFSARAGAGNFDRQELQDAIAYAHLRHMRVYVTVNTLVKQEELPEVLQVLQLLNELRADGILVQDLGILRLLRKSFPGLAVHASTQMALHNATGVAWCKKMGMRRVVLARECSLDEIERCVKVGPEIEVFGHGAQCVAVSGLCLFSSMLGERSGNRGRCAQPCRLNYGFDGKTGAWLSPRDVCLRDEIPALARAGVSSLKLEGRLKRPEYVAVVAGAYRKGIDSWESGRFQKADEAEREALRQIFNRGGFMDGYAFGCEDAGVIWPESVNHQGVPVGKVEAVSGNMARVRLIKPLRDGDGLRLRREKYEADMIYAGKDQTELAVLRLRPDVQARPGDLVLRLTDSRQLAEANALPGRNIAVNMELQAYPGQALQLRVTDGISQVVCKGEVVEVARNQAADGEGLRKNLARTGGTVFVPGEIRVQTAGAFVPVSALNALRRQALEELAEARRAAFAREKSAEYPVPDDTLPSEDLPFMVTVRNLEQAQKLRREGVRVIWYPEDFRQEALEKQLQALPEGTWLRLPDVCEEESLQLLHGLVCRYSEKLGGVVLGSVGQLGLSWPVPYGAGSSIPVMNRQAARLLLEEGCTFVTASPELTGRELRLLTENHAPVAVTVYGRTQLMLLHHCPARTVLGLDKGHGLCSMCDRGDARKLQGKELTDRRGYRYPLLRLRLPEGCLVRLLNALPTDIGDQQGLTFRCAEMNEEDAGLASEILDCLLSKQKTGLESTQGHWNRPVE